jgi:biofilm PGA synthesis protein PgaD
MSEIRIEDKPELRGVARTVIEWSFTSLMWALWIYLFLPMLSAILWIAGLHYIYRELFQASALAQLMDMLARTGWTIAVIFVVLRGWGYYNYFVFGRQNRRKQYQELTQAELGRHFGMTEQQVGILRSEKEIVWGASYDDIKLHPGRTARLVRQDASLGQGDFGSAADAAVPLVRIEFPDI